MLGFFKIKKLRTIIIIYWILLAYIIAALIYWFLLLNKQNEILTSFKIRQADISQDSNKLLANIAIDKHRKEIQYIAEGSTFLLLIITGAIFVYRAVRRQLKMSQLQHNFMMALTHELKTPISITKLNLETLRKRTIPLEVQQKLIANTLQEANRLNDLCSNMLLASQLEAGGYQFTYENLDLSTLANESVHEYKNRFPTRNFNAFIDKDVMVSADKLLVQIVLNNLLDNAMKYSPTDTPIKMGLLKKEKNVVLTISDEGPGIPDAEKEHVFKKFYRLGNQYTRESKGTGLGLYLSKTIVEHNGGKIRVDNNEPKGSVFTVTLPAYTNS